MVRNLGPPLTLSFPPLSSLPTPPIPYHSLLTPPFLLLFLSSPSLSLPSSPLTFPVIPNPAPDLELSPRRGPEAEPLVGGSGQSPPKAKYFCLI